MKLLITLFILTLSSAVSAFTYTQSFTEAQLQAAIEKSMPIVKKKYFLTMTLSNPNVYLIEDNNEIGLKADLAAMAPGLFKGEGSATIEGRLEYQKEEGAFYFKDPRLVALTSNDIPTKWLTEIQAAAQSSLSKSLSKRPVYVLKDDDVKQKIAKSTLESIVVKDNQLEVNFRLF